MHELDGKQRRLRRLFDQDDRISILAVDHTESLRAAIAPDFPNDDDALTAAKLQLIDVLHETVGGVLLDPFLGAMPALAQDLIPSDCGLMISVEGLDYNDLHAPPELLEGWTPEGALRAGADALKVLVYHRPDAHDASDREQFVRDLAATCDGLQLPLLVEPLPYPLAADNGSPFDGRLLVESAARMRDAGADLLKVPFPPGDDVVAETLCVALTVALEETPWVLLSQGVDTATYLRQLEVASRSGAAGFAAGRSIWGDLLGSSPAETAEIGGRRLSACRQAFATTVSG